MNKLISYFKPRFSHFLILGILGFIFIGISFLSWKTLTLKTSDIISSLKNLNTYLLPQWFSVCGSLLISGCAVGFFICAKKEDKEVKIGSLVLFISYVLFAIMSLIIIFVALKNKKTFMLTEFDKFIYFANSFKLVCLIASVCSLLLLAFGLKEASSKDSFNKGGRIVAYTTNGLFTVYSLVLFVSNIFTDCIKSLFCYYQSNLSYPFSKCRYNINFLSIGTYKNLQNVIEEISIKELGSIYPYGIALGFQILLLFYILGNILFLSLLLVPSFDCEKDDNRLSL